MAWWERVEGDWIELTALGTMLAPVLMAVTLVAILRSKKNATSAVAWCLVVFFLPFLGPLLYLLLGYQHISRPLSRKRRHMRYFQRATHAALPESTVRNSDRETGARDQKPASAEVEAASCTDLRRLSRRLGAFPITSGNQVDVYNEGVAAFASMMEAIRSARHHIHLETFIFQADATGQMFFDLLAEKARQGVQVRLLYDAMGTRRRGRKLLQSIGAAGGKASAFLQLNLYRRRFQVNMRNHRKILVVDGQVGFIGGLNVGDEYAHKNPRFGYWRDTHLRLSGPAVASLQSVFIEDWDFAYGENLQDPVFFPAARADGATEAQIIDSGPDRDLKAIRDIYFAAILSARRRLWIASPYFVPDDGLHDALCLAAYRGVDVRLLSLYCPDKWIPYFAARYYFVDVLEAGMKIYQYTRGMMHSKVILVDGEWATVGTANLDNRSLHLNFEVNCQIYSAEIVARLEEAFEEDLQTAIRLDRRVFAQRAFALKLVDNAARLLSPVL